MDKIDFGDLNGMNLLKGGVQVSHELKDVECDPRLKRAIIELANNQQFIGKKINDCVDIIRQLAGVLSALINITETVENKMYKKQFNYEEDPEQLG